MINHQHSRPPPERQSEPYTQADLSTMFAEAADENRIAAMVDLTTPEVTGMVSACGHGTTARLAAARLSDAADDAMSALAATDRGDQHRALRAWATLTGPADTTDGGSVDGGVAVRIV